jgi:hypothetical protein
MSELVTGRLQYYENRILIKKKMIELGLDNRRAGGYRGLLPRLSERMEHPVSAQMLSNAITGYQSGEAAQELLTAVKEMLESWPVEPT